LHKQKLTLISSAKVAK